MILVSYEVSNWGPHKHQVIEFPKGAKTIALCAENDQGKSWILRGIGFTLSIGRNEYGDQSSVHVGETEAHHKLTISHNNEEHIIEKIVKTKDNEDEGTITKVNGETVDRAGYELFYNRLGLSHPSIWLPIVISMQNETDFHLRSKKRDREEALRAACQLTKIDSWKDSLQTKINEEDKKLLEESATMRSKVETLSKELKSLNDTKTSLEEKLSKLSTKHSIEDALSLVATFEECLSNKRKEELELKNKNREHNLNESAKQRAIADLAEVPGANLEEEISWEETKSVLDNELNNRTRKETFKKLISTNKQLEEKEEELEKLGKLLAPENIKDLQTAISNWKENESKLTQKKKDRDNVSTSFGFTSIVSNDALEIEKAKLCEEKINAQELATKVSNLLFLEKKYRDSIEKVTFLPCKIKDFSKSLKLVEKIIEENKELSHTGAISEDEGQALLIRVLNHWEESDSHDCPICRQSLEENKSFAQPLLRSALLDSLKGEEHTRDAKLHQSAIVARENLPLWMETYADLSKLKIDPIENTDFTESQNSFIAKIEKNINAIDNIILINKEIDELEKEIEKISSDVCTVLPGTSSINVNAAEAIIKEQEEKSLAKKIKETEIKSLRKEVDLIQERLDSLPESIESIVTSANFLSADDLAKKSNDDISKDIKDLTLKISTSKKHRLNRASKEKALADAENKWNHSKEALEKITKIVDSLRGKITTGCGMYIPSKIQDYENLNDGGLALTDLPDALPSNEEDLEEYWEKIAAAWRKIEKEKEKIETLLADIPEKIETLQKTISESEDELKKVQEQVQKAATARKVLQFLDYKNAPRKLLQTIVERLFATTNKIGETLQVDIRLVVGKNLEFLSQQCRYGRWIEQKTERLGFGKGAILGICFRLACQKLLLPETGFLILDEPTANVDLKRKSALKAFLQNLSEETESKTKQIIMIEHDLDVIELCQAKIQIGEKSS
jgi:DNA repair exonuclease SbcCD ATPase subunit